MARPSRQLPAEVAVDWPDVASAEPTVETARLLALNLREALGKRSLRAAKEITGVDHTTIAAILNGTTWADLHTIARLEAGLGADLWPRRR